MKNRLQNQVRTDHNPNSKSLQGKTKQRKTPAKRKFPNVGNLPSAAAAQPPAPPPAGAGQETETYAHQHFGWPYDYTKLGLTALAEAVEWTDRKAIVHMATALCHCHREIRRLLLPKIEDQKFALEVAEVLLMAIEIDAHQPDTITSSDPIWDTYLTGLTNGLASPRHMDDRTLLARFALVISSPVAPFRDLFPCLNLFTAAHLAEALVIAEFITDCEGCVTERTHSPTTSLQTLACELRTKHFMGQLERFEQMDNAA